MPEPAPLLSVVLPAFNEARRLPQSLTRLPGELEAAVGPDFEILVADDGSQDDTARLATEAAAGEDRIRVLDCGPNRGKGSAVRCGVRAARGRWILVSDVDLSTPPADVLRLFRAARHRGVGCAIGSRRVAGSRILQSQLFHRQVLGAVFAVLRRLLLLPTLCDTQCGFKLFTADAARAIFTLSRENGWIYDVETLVLARRLGIRVVEVGVRWSDDVRSQVEPLPAARQMLFGLLRLAARRFGRALLPPLQGEPPPASSNGVMSSTSPPAAGLHR